MKTISKIVVFTFALGLCFSSLFGENEIKEKSSPDSKTAQVQIPKIVNDKYPGLSSGILSFAKLGDLPENTLLTFNDLKITDKDLEEEITKSGVIKEEADKNKFFMLEQAATSKILLQLAKQNEKDIKNENSGKSAKTDEELIKGYFEKLFSDLEVTEAEITDCYEKNKDMCGGATLTQMKDSLKDFVMQQKKQDKATEHIRSLGQNNLIVVSSSFAEKQSVTAKDNPVDKARASGKPSLVDFGATGCKPCDMLAPILETLKKKYEGKANVLFINVREQQLLGGRYGIQSIPVQVFFDKDGKETFRHTGFYPQVEIEKKMKESGVE